MTEPATASTQYGDLKGTICIDGHNGLSIDDLLQKADVPKGYRPIGIRISGSSKNRGEKPSVRAKVLCVDTDQTGFTSDGIRSFGKEHGELHTFEFDAEIDLDMIVSLIKRYSIVLLSKLTRGIDVKIQPIQD
ncbi:hypothetical protein [Planctomycetes bacterium TBK1r]|uniref:hypothetical protein n=1 Tax=Stieleria magnilauensis TaxID=2527963 RepID=UPI0011A4198D